MTAVVTAAFLTLAPSPYDLLTAHADLTAPVGSPVAADRTPRARVAALLVLHQLGGLDADAGEYRWFAAELGWGHEHDHARRVLARVRECPTLAEGAWVPPASWFAAEAAAYSATAAAWRRRAEDYRAREAWEADRAADLSAWAAHFEAVAAWYESHACRLSGWAGGSWTRPRRVVIGEVREFVGPAAWASRRWPGGE